MAFLGAVALMFFIWWALTFNKEHAKIIEQENYKLKTELEQIKRSQENEAKN